MLLILFFKNIKWCTYEKEFDCGFSYNLKIEFAEPCSKMDV